MFKHKKISIIFDADVDMIEKVTELRKIKGIKQMTFKFKGV